MNRQTANGQRSWPNSRPPKSNSCAGNLRLSKLAHVVQTEWIRYRLADQSGYATLELRVSMAFRLEEGGWRILHRHADPNLDVAPASGPESL